MKKMEAELRKTVKYKYKLSANLDMVNPYTLDKLHKAGIFIDKIIESAVFEFYKEATKTVVRVDHEALDRIRLEALDTQQSLIVEEQEKTYDFNTSIDCIDSVSSDQNIFSDPSDVEVSSNFDIWDMLKDALNENELKALDVIIVNGDLKKFADESGIMLEVLVDGINEKAMDYIGDNILDEDMAIYEDYEEYIKGMVKTV